HISFGNEMLLGNAFGAKEAVRQLIDVRESLMRAFRKTDLVARDGVDFWILTPYTPATENIADKIRSIIEQASLDGLDIADRHVCVFSLPLTDGHPIAENRSALEFLRSIKSMCATKNCGSLCEPLTRREIKGGAFQAAAMSAAA
ncbi:MAG: hypothetical protein Q7J02_11150, partial [Rhodocyclaceae bacterium]|nr:hypothetical protein [Rhodocyclaceae bacterium]